MSQENLTKRRYIRMTKEKIFHARMGSWKNRPSPKNWHEYDEWQKEHYKKYSIYKKKHVRAKMSRKYQRKAVWNGYHTNNHRNTHPDH